MEGGIKITRRGLLASAAALAAVGRTRIDARGGVWRINGRVTYPGAKTEGLLMNVRMVNAVFEDANAATRPQGFDPARNTDRFLQKVPDYVAQGILAFTINLQGGDPGYEGAVNSAINPDGTLRKSYLARVAAVINSCDRSGAAVILSCFYQRQDQLLNDVRAVRAAVVNVAGWIRKSGFRNVLLEIANEFGHRGYDHPILRSASGQADLIRLARQTAPGLLVSTSGLGDGRIAPEVAAAADYLTPHLNSTAIADVPRRIQDLKRFGKPIVVNEDDKVGALGAQAARVCVENGASWGLMLVNVNQHYPFRFTGAGDDPAVYAALRRLTTAGDYFPPPDSQGGWRALTDARDLRRIAAMNRDRLDEAFEYIQGSTKNGGLLVLRKGWLVYERYFGLGHRDATPNLASCGKSFTSVSMGILLGERPEIFPDGLDQMVWTPDYLPPEAFPLTDPRKADIKLGQLLAMTAGIRGNNPVYVRGRPDTIDPAGPDGSPATIDAIAFGLQDEIRRERHYSTRTLWCEPGGGYSYATASPHVVSAILRHVTGAELLSFVESHLASALGWGTWGYGYKRAGLGHTPGGGGIALRATDMLRFGYLLAKDGRWNDAQVIPRDYVRHCSRQSPYNPHFPYSLQFDVNTDGHERRVPRDAFWKMGSGGHVLYIVPSMQLVIWKLGGRDGQYAPADTGLPPSPASPEQIAARRGWKETVDAETARRRTLEIVVSAALG
jgi:CubicO group peptidase (beta-lactamase class C family)